MALPLFYFDLSTLCGRLDSCILSNVVNKLNYGIRDEILESQDDVKGTWWPFRSMMDGRVKRIFVIRVALARSIFKE